MVKVNPTEKHEYYMDGVLKDNLDLVKPKINKDWDMCFTVGGIEGTGKSTLTFQLAAYCSGKRFTIDHICFTPEDFEIKITQKDFLKPGDSLVLDEGFFINARSSMTELNRRFLGILAECRQKNLFLFIVCPNFFDLDKNIALWRSRGLFYVYHDKMERGFFKFYNYERKKLLYVSGKKFYDYSKTNPNFIGRFTKYMPVDIKEYKERKLKAFNERKRTRGEDKYIRQRNICFMELHTLGLTHKQISDCLKKKGEIISGSAIQKALTEGNLNYEP